MSDIDRLIAAGNALADAVFDSLDPGCHCDLCKHDQKRVEEWRALVADLREAK